eukprot:SAG31_NODE_2676_length_5264_cov_576.907278_6_plen_203_part_00
MSLSSEDEAQEEIVVDDELLFLDARIFVQAWNDTIDTHAVSLDIVESDAAVLFSASDGQSFWLPASEAAALSPSTKTLERLAADIYTFHVNRLKDTALQEVEVDPNRSGAEFWIQCRGQAHTYPTGTGGTVAAQNESERLPGKSESTDQVETQTINWHFDKDEELLDQTDLYLHPLVSTITYLGTVGAPTVIGDVRLDVRPS